MSPINEVHLSSPSNKVLVVGGGIAGIQCAIDLAELGINTYIVEQGPSIGGKMAMLDKTFPTGDCAMCILGPKMIECATHPNIKIFTLSKVEEVKGKQGDFKVKIKKIPRFIEEEKCTGCGECFDMCPVEIPSEFDLNLGKKKAISKPFPQAIPNVAQVYKAGLSPCTEACPAGVKVPAYIALVQQKRLKEALNIICEALPLPGVCARVCHRPCEQACLRGTIDESVAISSIKRFVTDAVELEPLSFPIVYPQKIAIIGSGPAGISCAFELRKIGYEPTIFEALPVPGGMLSTAIPEYRLPTKVVKEEITRIQESGVKILLNTPIQDLEGLFSAGFSAIFIASGAGESLKLKIPGEDTKGVVSSLELLKQVKLGNLSFEPKRPVIIGGGNSAVDAARTLLRLGAAQVTICYRRSLNEMPALAWEIKAAQKEGIKIKFLTSPIKIIEEKGRVKSIICRRMKLGEPDQSGRRRPIPIPHSEQEIETDLVVGAIGERPSLKWLPHPWRSKLAPDGFIHIQPQTGKTKIPGIFAGGDVTTGPKTVIEAIAAGKNAAYGIHSYLQKQSLPKKTPRYKIKAEDIEKEKIQSKSRIVPLSLQIKDRIKNFNEVELGYDSEGVLKECQRCLFCAKCTECLKCVEVCQKKAIFHDMETSFFELQVGAIVIATGTNVAEKPLYEYGFKRFKNVITSLELERMMSSLGPTQGEILRPSDQKNPQNIGFVQCVGSRDLRHLPYCSSVCCMYTVKQAMIINEHYPHTKSFIFFTDIRAQGKEFQQYINRGKEYYNITYIRARPGQIIEKKETNNLEIWFEDTYEAKRRKIEVNLLVLCQPLIPNDDTQRLASILGITLDKHGFFSVRDPLSHPVDSSKEGIFICGTCEGPKDIPDSVIQASAVGFRVMESLNRLSREKDF